MKQLCCLLCFVSFWASAQDFSSHKQMISLQIDNDLFVPQEEDNYYTSGIFLNYAAQVNSFPFLKRRENERLLLDVVIGQQLFTPIYPNSTYIENYDRPFAGWLFGKLQLYKVKDKRTIIYGVTAGVTGEASFGKQIHQGFHDFMNIEEKPEWLAQIPFEVMLNLNYGYAYELRKWLVPSINASIGTKDIFLEPGLLFLWNMKNISFVLPANQSKISAFVKTNYRLVGYDALIEGSVFFEKPKVTKAIVNHMFLASAGMQFQWRKLGMQMAYHYQTKQTSQMHSHIYGSLKIFYLF